MEILKNDYVVGMWFAEKKDFCNIQLMILKRAGKWVGEYRFRYFVDNKVYGSKDRRSFYTLKIPDYETEEKVIETGNYFIKMLKDAMGF